jgi:hypothetical protein
VFGLDGNPVEMATFAVAAMTCLIRPIRRMCRHVPPLPGFTTIAVDLLPGTAIVPFVLLIGSVFSSELLEATLRSNRLFLALGGVVGLMVVVRGYFVGG